MTAEPWPVFRAAEPPPPHAHVTVTASSARHKLSNAIRIAFEDAMAQRGRLPEEAFQVHGFSGRKFRILMNNLMGDVPDARYLEIGLFHGASFCAAVARHRIRAVGIDNWTEYGGRPKFFHENLEKFKSDGADISVIENDFRKVDFGQLGKFNILFYDGSHEEQDQYDGVIAPQPALDDDCIIIVDDWNWDHVRRGTFNALADAKRRIEYSIEVRTTFSNEHLPQVHGQTSEWHNGCIIAVTSKV